MTQVFENGSPLPARFSLRCLIVCSFALLAIASVSALCYGYLNNPSAFNSDNLMPSDLCEDLLHGRHLTEWHLPGAPYLFPDLLLLVPCQRLAPTLPLAFLVYCLTIHLSCFSLLTWLGRMGGLGWSSALILASCGVMLLACTYMNHPTYLSLLLVHPASHVGALVVGLFLLALTVHAVQRGVSWTLAAMYVPAGAMGAFSDRLLIPQFLAPLSLALIVLAVPKVLSRKRTGMVLVLLASSLLCSRLLNLLFKHLGFHLLEVEQVSPKLRLADLAILLHRLREIAWQDAFVGCLFLLHLPVALLVLCRGFRDSHQPAATGEPPRSAMLIVPLTLLLSPFAIVGALFVLGMSHNPAIDRYTLSCWYLPALFLPLLLGWIPGRTATAARLVLQGSIAVFAFYHLATLLPRLEAAKFAQPYPPLAQALDQLARERGPLRGLAGYWAARSNAFFTREKVWIDALSPEAAPYFHTTNPARFLCEDAEQLRLPRYQFLIVRATDSYGPSGGLLSLQYGEPKEKIAVGPDEIWLYDSVRIPALERFLRARLAEQMVRQRPCTGPSEPACLAQPKANMAPSSARGTVPLEPGRNCEARFAGPITGRLLDIGASAEARLDVMFFRGEQQLGSLAVPNVPWTGADTYMKAGIQSRLLRLPESLRKQSWDRLVFRLRGETADARLGHVLVLNEDAAGLEEPSCSRPPTRARLEAEDLFPYSWCPFYSTETDAAASAGQYRRAPADFRYILLHVPPLYLPPGRYRLHCAMKVDDTRITEPVASLLIRSRSPGTSLAKCSWRGTDFAAAGRWQTQTATFEVPADVEGVEFAILGEGRASFSVDYLDVIAGAAE